ncbi:juvenile hormone acid O-methyltransferase isoform X1 [Diachasma alloeum]|uniref:juvenile hormone acid O-methyltransferase isoform X1 n=1 Tax=Diachasma alloeum TaxID=454923 RepID=UPI0010FAD02D|nr:juvenile hormone acid O-methyltransferase isoform X1 [Diachasma alloeum]
MNQPKEYAESNDLTYRDVDDLIKEFPEEFKKMKGRIIDVGCGPGNITKGLLLPNVEKDAVIVVQESEIHFYLGADLCAAMVEYAKQHHEVKHRLSYIQLDIQTPELPENLIGQFDNAVSFYCLNWCRNTQLTMQNFYKLLRPGGKAIILMISHHMIFDVYAEQAKDAQFSTYMQDSNEIFPPHHGHPNAEEMLRKDLNEVGFKIQYCSNRWKSFTFRSWNALIDFMMSVNPFVKRMPDDLQEDYREDVEKRLKIGLPKKRSGNSDENSADFSISLLTAVFEKPLN